MVEVSKKKENSMIILDFGSGNGCGNEKKNIRKLIDSVEGFDCVIKWQLFTSAPPNIPLRYDLFTYAYDYAERKGLRTTASVFDPESLEFLQTFETPFIKIANRADLYYLARGIDSPLVISYPASAEMGKRKNITPLCCVSNYPAKIATYEKRFPSSWLSVGISDHTVGLDLYHKYMPEVWEKHYVIEHNFTDPDAKGHSITPMDLGEI